MKQKQKPRRSQKIAGVSSVGDLAGIRTPDPLLKRQLLCRLSYQVLWQGRRDSNPLYQSQSLVCYRYTTSLWMPPSDVYQTGRADRNEYKNGVGNGTRTHDTRNHNPVL